MGKEVDSVIIVVIFLHGTCTSTWVNNVCTFATTLKMSRKHPSPRRRTDTVYCMAFCLCHRCPSLTPSWINVGLWRWLWMRLHCSASVEVKASEERLFWWISHATPFEVLSNRRICVFKYGWHSEAITNKLNRKGLVFSVRAGKTEVSIVSAADENSHSSLQPLSSAKLLFLSRPSCVTAMQLSIW